MSEVIKQDLKTEALKLALEFIEANTYGGDDVAKLMSAIREALAEQPAQEPVAWMDANDDVFFTKNDGDKTGIAPIRPLYTHPAPQRKPLTDEELRAIENKINPNMRWRSSDEEGITLYPIEYYELVRAIEAAHGIIGEQK